MRLTWEHREFASELQLATDSSDVGRMPFAGKAPFNAPSLDRDTASSRYSAYSLSHGVVGKTVADRNRLPQQSDGHFASQRPQPQFARTDEGVIPQRPEFLERRIPRDQQSHSATVLNGRPQQPHQLHELLQ